MIRLKKLMVKRNICWILTLAMVMSLVVIPSNNVYATNVTADQAIAWVQSQVGKPLDVDGAYGAQCVDLIMAYYDYLGVPRASGNAVDYTTNALPSGWQRIKGAQPQKGDILVYTGGDGHVAIYEADRITYHQNIDKVQSVQKVSYKYDGLHTPYWGVIRPNWSSATSPTNPSILTNQLWYDIADTIQIKAHADGATSYFMSIFKDGNKIISQGVTDGFFSMSASKYGYGKYSAYFSCSNSAGTVDTQWVNFSVVGAPSYTDVYASNWWYDLSDTVSISVDTVCAKGQLIGIDKEGIGRVVTESSDPTFKMDASKLGVGKYSAYFSVYNSSGGVDTTRVSFEIVDKPKEGAVVSTMKEKYTLNDEVELSVLVYCSKSQLVRIDKEGVGRVVTDSANNGVYKIAASNLGKGKYSAYFYVSNNSGGYETSHITFEIGCSHKYISNIIKEPTCDGTGVKKYICTECDESYTETIDALGHKYVDTVIKPTESESGYTLHKCKECGYSYKDSYTDALQKSTEPDIKHIINNTNKDISNTAINNTYVNATAIKSVNSGKKSIKIKWKKVSGVSGYQLQYATNKSFKKGKKITIKSNSTTVRTIRKLKNKKKYYVRIRTYKVSNNKTIYSKWSATRNKKTK